MVSVGVDWQTVLKGAGTLGVGGAVVKFAPGVLSWWLSRGKRAENSSLAMAKAHEIDAQTAEIKMRTEMERRRGEREELLAQGDVLGLLRSYMGTIAKLDQEQAGQAAEIVRFKADLQSVRGELADTRVELANTRVELAAARGERDVVFAELVEERKRSADQEAKLNTAIATATDLAGQLAAATARIHTLETQVRALGGTV